MSRRTGRGNGRIVPELNLKPGLCSALASKATQDESSAEP
jgi:hypothetical protein